MMLPPPCFTVEATCSRKEECGGMRNYYKYMVPTVNHGGGSIMVWGKWVSWGSFIDIASSCNTMTQSMACLMCARNKVLDHPPQSPDLNPIEHLWEELRAKGKKFRNKDEAWKFYRTEWEKISEETLKKLVDSMPRRLAEVIHSKGYPTKY
uniref:Tc1-like transposase DDE domain-containing protein n=1 Tax=Acrobeloides nanus TaxID=290746 RepID=A0A914E673_9BILA